MIKEEEMDTSIYIVVSTLVGNLIGYVLKNKTAFKNKMIPIVLVAMMAIKNLLVAAGLLPQEAAILHMDSASMPDSLAMAGFFNWNILLFVLNTVLDTALPTGMHAMGKNFTQPVK